VAYRCEICDKHVAHGFNVSKSKRHTKRIWKPNIQHVRARINGKVRRIYVCTACLRSGRVDRAI
jgi:large subunit ribosomal protein L28